jgi:hypothetical protein
MEIKVATVTQYQDVDSNTTLQAVPWSIVEGETELQSGTQSFPLEATADEIRAFLSQALQTYKDDAARHEETKAFQDSLDNATTVGAEISNTKISV